MQGRRLGSSVLWPDGDDIRRLTTGGEFFTGQQATPMRTAIDGYRLSAAK
jgi:hypothetical protein